jgi:hypothetical protein
MMKKIDIEALTIVTRFLNPGDFNRLIRSCKKFLELRSHLDTTLDRPELYLNGDMFNFLIIDMFLGHWKDSMRKKSNRRKEKNYQKRLMNAKNLAVRMFDDMRYQEKLHEELAIASLRMKFDTPERKASHPEWTLLVAREAEKTKWIVPTMLMLCRDTQLIKMMFAVIHNGLFMGNDETTKTFKKKIFEPNVGKLAVFFVRYLLGEKFFTIDAKFSMGREIEMTRIILNTDGVLLIVSPEEVVKCNYWTMYSVRHLSATSDPWESVKKQLPREDITEFYKALCYYFQCKRYEVISNTQFELNIDFHQRFVALRQF